MAGNFTIQITGTIGSSREGETAPSSSELAASIVAKLREDGHSVSDATVVNSRADTKEAETSQKSE